LALQEGLLCIAERASEVFPNPEGLRADRAEDRDVPDGGTKTLFDLFRSLVEELR
jgi:hypothetical protein